MYTHICVHVDYSIAIVLMPLLHVYCYYYIIVMLLLGNVFVPLHVAAVTPPNPPP